MKKAFLLALALLVTARGASAQIHTGNVYGVVNDQSGALLPGVAVTIAGELGRRTTSSGSTGEFRFLSLDRGHYSLTLALSGFTSLVREVDVVTGENVELSLTLAMGGLEESVTVAGESPLVSTRKRGTSTTMTTEELERVPTARRPVGGAPDRARRPDLPREHRGQRERAAGRDHGQGRGQPNLP